VPYKLFFKEAAKKEWDRLDTNIQKIFKKKLASRLSKPHNKSSRLSGMKNCYKIKLRRIGYRLVYQVRDKDLVVIVVAVGKREKNFIYKKAMKRI